MRYSGFVVACLAVKHCVALDPDTLAKSEAVKQAFVHAWSGYTRCAGSKDILNPIQCQGSNIEGGWSVTNIDAIGTALVMNLTEIANEQILAAVNVDFSKLGPGEENEGLVSSFETTIRYLGGLLSVHDLLHNGYGESIPSYETKAQQLLIQAKTLGDTLSPVWNTLSGLPAKYLNLSTTPAEIYHGPDVGDSNSPAGIGTSQLEYARLSNLTAEPSYVAKSVIAARKLFTPVPESGITLAYPGMIGSKFNINTGEMSSDVGGWIAPVQSYYEYLLKLYIYNPAEYPDFLAQYALVATSTLKHLVSHPTAFPNATYVAAHVGKLPTYNSQHMTCATGGSLLQASAYLNDPQIRQLGEDLVNGCRFLAEHTSKGIPPEAWVWLDNIDPVPTVEPTDMQAEFIKTHGYWSPDESEFYYLRPEYLESLFYAYRVTKDQKYRDWAWDAFRAINASSYTQNGYVPIRDVTSDAKPRNDQDLLDAGLGGMESFFLAETLKYAYLIFQDDDVLSLSDWVFNNEGHPIRIQSRDVERKANAECFKYAWCANKGWY